MQTLTMNRVEIEDPIPLHSPSVPVPSKMKDLLEIVGGLSNPSKMPGSSYSIPAQRCNVGAKLRKVKGSVCSGCYALKGCYVFPVVREALERRYQSLKDPRWVSAMICLLNKKRAPEFRWHDSGDIQSINHLRNIAQVCELTPDKKHWLPTREYGIVEAYVERYGELPENLCVRASAHMIGKRAPRRFRNSSMVMPKHTETKYEGVHVCPAQSQGNECGECRACWNVAIETIAYPLH